MRIRTQLLKGVLEACILAVIKVRPVYGYELSQVLKEKGLRDVSEGTIYPVLLRLEKNGLIRGERQPSDYGPNRKYYFITAEGEVALEMITKEWDALVNPVTELLKGGLK